MSDLPERIWADPPEIFDGAGTWRSEPGGKAVEYTRSDLCVTRAELEAAVLAERERCAKVAESFHFTRTHTDEFLGNTMSSSLVKPFKVAAAIRAQGETSRNHPRPDPEGER